MKEVMVRKGSGQPLSPASFLSARLSVRVGISQGTALSCSHSSARSKGQLLVLNKPHHAQCR